LLINDGCHGFGQGFGLQVGEIRCLELFREFQGVKRDCLHNMITANDFGLSQENLLDSLSKMISFRSGTALPCL
jgi:hypothetical protein